MRSGDVFSIQAITADIARGTGGRRIKSEKAIRRKSAHNDKDHGTITIEMQDHGGRVVTIHRKLIEYVNGHKVIK